MKDAEGNVFPVGAGEYPLEDGKILIVGEDGKIAEVKEIEVESEMSSEDIIATFNSLSQKISDLQSALDSKNAELSAVSEELAKAKTEATVSATELAALKKAPAAPSVKEKKATLSASAPAKAWAQMTYQERVMAQIQNIKK
jgi:crotonobetainyl-CoA:carnitine CoA-transferase CaiB-like acyl-CoA transferase